MMPRMARTKVLKGCKTLAEDAGNVEAPVDVEDANENAGNVKSTRNTREDTEDPNVVREDHKTSSRNQ